MAMFVFRLMRPTVAFLVALTVGLFGGYLLPLDISGAGALFSMDRTIAMCAAKPPPVSLQLPICAQLPPA